MKKLTPKGEKSRQKILQSAISLFAQKGFSGTSVDEIVAHADVNKRMVYHYFGNKESLYQEVLKTEYDKLESLEIETLQPEESINKIIPDIVDAYFTFLQNNPDFVQLILWENLNQGRNLDQMEVPVSKSPILDLLIQAIKAGQKNKTIRPEIDARFLLISLIGNCMIYCSNRYTLSRTLNINLESKAMLTHARKAVSDMLLHGIRSTTMEHPLP